MTKAEFETRRLCMHNAFIEHCYEIENCSTHSGVLAAQRAWYATRRMLDGDHPSLGNVWAVTEEDAVIKKCLARFAHVCDMAQMGRCVTREGEPQDD
jgi:hypothetical protein